MKFLINTSNSLQQKQQTCKTPVTAYVLSSKECQQTHKSAGLPINTGVTTI